MRDQLWMIVACLGLIGCGSSGTSSPSAAAPPLLHIPATASPAVKEVYALLKQGDLAAATTAADKAINANPQEAAAYDVRAHIAHSAGHLTDALADLDRSIELVPDNARALNNRGFVRLSLQQFDGALADFDAAEKLDPSLASIYNNRALVAIARGRFRQAVADLDLALQREPQYVDALNNRGFALLQLQRLDRALADLNQALEINPKYVNAWNNRGLVKRAAGDLDGAVLDFTQAMLNDPQNPKYYDHRREVYVLQGAHDKAREDERKIAFLTRLRTLNAIIEADAQQPAAYLARAEHYRQQGDETLALRDFDRAVELSADDPAARLKRAEFLLELKRYEGALADCAAVLAHQEHPSARSIRGDCLRAQRLYADAVAEYRAARRIDQGVVETLVALADQCDQQGNAPAANEARQKADEMRAALNGERTSAVAQPFPEELSAP